MANEIGINLSANCRNGGLNLPWQPVSVQVDQATPGADLQTPTVPAAAHEAMDFGEVATPGFVGLNVRDSAEANYIEIGVDVAGTFYPVIRVDKDAPAAFKPAAGATLYQKADSADVKVVQTTYSA